MPYFPNTNPITTDKSKDLEKWVVFPETLPNQRFTGFQNREDQSQVRGAFVLGQNVTFGGASLPALRRGYEVLGTENADATPVQRAWMFETRAGVQFDLKLYDTKLVYWLQGVSTDWALLKSGLTANTDWGFANIGKSADSTLHTEFSNGTDGFFKWNGAYAYVDSTSYVAGAVAAAAINVAGTGYVVGDTITVAGGGVNATFSVSTVGGSGAVTGLVLTNPGSGYSSTAGVATTTSGVGINLTVNTTVGTGWIKKSGTTTWAAEGFYTTTDRTLINGTTTFTYASDAASVYVVGIGSDPTGMVAGSIILQAPATVSGLSGVQGSVMMAHDGRLHMRQESKQSVWNYSKLDDPFNFTVATPDEDGNAGSKDIEYSGPITAYSKLNKVILCFKKRQIKLLSFYASGSRVDISKYESLVPADDRGTTLGALAQKAVFSTPLGVVFVTPDKRLALLSGITANNEPQYLFLSDPIQPVFTKGVFDDAVGICVDNVIYLAFKQDSTSTYNDVVIRGDMTRQSIDSMGRILPIRWDAPFVGWNVNDWTVIYDSTTGKNEIRWHSSLNSNSYRLIDQKSDNTTGYTGIVRTWAETFGAPANQKKIEEAFVEVRMNENTNLLATLLYDEDGYTGRDETTLAGTSTTFRFGTDPYNPYGASSYGVQKMGSNGDTDALPTYRFHLEVNNNIYFYNLSLQLSSDGDGQDFELVRFGYKLTEIQSDTDHKYLKQ